MSHVIVKHKVKDFGEWKKVFNSAYDFRKANGETNYQIYTDVDEPNMVIGLFEYPNQEMAKAFFEMNELKQKMMEAGVVGEPAIHFVQAK